MINENTKFLSCSIPPVMLGMLLVSLQQVYNNGHQPNHQEQNTH